MAIVGKVLGADDFHAYPTIEMGLGPSTLVVAAVVLASGIAPWRGGLSRQGRRRPMVTRRGVGARALDGRVAAAGPDRTPAGRGGLDRV